MFNIPKDPTVVYTVNIPIDPTIFIYGECSDRSDNIIDSKSPIDPTILYIVNIAIDPTILYTINLR